MRGRLVVWCVAARVCSESGMWLLTSWVPIGVPHLPGNGPESTAVLALFPLPALRPSVSRGQHPS